MRYKENNTAGKKKHTSLRQQDLEPPKCHNNAASLFPKQAIRHEGVITQTIETAFQTKCRQKISNLLQSLTQTILPPLQIVITKITIIMHQSH